LAELGQVTPLPAFAVGLSPRPVKDASNAYAKALGKLTEARAAVESAKQDASDAAWADRDAARKAAKAGRKPPKATTPAARLAVEDAERMVPALESAAREAQDRYLTTLRKHREAITETAESRLRTVEGSVRSLCNELEGAITQREALVRLLGELSRPGLGEGKHPILNVREVVALDRDRTEALATLRVNGDGAR
jgi:hypothetical protein